ncbi:MAG: hypothetical protein QOD38_698, partial [Acidimicrobiaceae bacterium]
LHAGPQFDAAAFAEDVIAHPKVASWSLDPEVIRAALVTDPAPDYADAVRRVFAAYAEAHGKPRYGDKTPRYVLSLPLLATLFPEARFVHIIRDGRDVAPSLMKAHWGPATITRAALNWQQQVEQGRTDGRALGPSRYLEIRYEELVADPQPIVEELCNFLDLPFAPEMLRPEARFERVMAGEPNPHLHTGLERPITVGLRDWRTDLEGRDIAAIESLVGDTLRSTGYELSNDARVRARSWWLRLSHAVRRVTRRLVRAVRPAR